MLLIPPVLLVCVHFLLSLVTRSRTVPELELHFFPSGIFCLCQFFYSQKRVLTSKLNFLNIKMSFCVILEKYTQITLTAYRYSLLSVLGRGTGDGDFLWTLCKSVLGSRFSWKWLTKFLFRTILTSIKNASPVLNASLLCCRAINANWSSSV